MKYKLSDLMDQCNPKADFSDEELVWLNLEPVGLEIIDDMDYFIKSAHNLNQTKEELYSLYDFIFNLIEKEDFLLYNNILDKLDITLISNGLIVGLIRTSFLYRNKISNWSLFVEKSKQELYKRNPYNKLLKDF